MTKNNENALIDMWQKMTVLYGVTGFGFIIIGFLTYILSYKIQDYINFPPRLIQQLI